MLLWPEERRCSAAALEAWQVRLEEMQMTTLADLREGQSAIIEDVVGDDSMAQRLMEMGMTDGERVRLVGFAPLGDPIEFAVRGYRLTLRRSEAHRVKVIDSSVTDNH